MSRDGRREALMATGACFAADPEDLGLDVLAAMVRASSDGLIVLDRDLRYVYANPAACTLLGQELDELLGCDDLSGPQLCQRFQRDRLVAVLGGKPERWEAVLHRPDGSELDIVCTATRLEFRSRELLVVGLRDVSERRRRARKAAALAQAAASVAVSDSIEATVQALAESALRGTCALGAAVWLNDTDDLPVWIGAAGLPDGYPDTVRLAGSPGCRHAIHRTMVVEQRMVVDPEARRRLESEPALAFMSDRLTSMPWQAGVFAPLVYQGEVVGLLQAFFREGEPPTDEETAFLATLADQAAVAAVNARLMADARDKAALEERQRLARELHDSVSQALYGIALGARTARDRIEHDPARIAEPVDYILQLAEAGMAEMRALIFELRPESLEIEGLAAALAKQADAVRARHGVAGRTIASVEPVLPLEVKQALYRIAQEALQNTIKHAGAGRVDVRLELDPGEVLLAIEDDGLGFEPDANFPGHLGLRSMRERAAGVGGTLEVDSSPGQGTRILVRVPMPPP